MEPTTSANNDELIHLAGYKFIDLINLPDLKNSLENHCQRFSLLGTILLSEEGININLAGKSLAIDSFKAFLETIVSLQGIVFHQTMTRVAPYEQLKVKIKDSIITMRTAEVKPHLNRAPTIDPKTLKLWLDERKDMVLLDSRNEYEVRFGTFKNAINPEINNFSAFVKSIGMMDPDKPVVTFCTGGIRCEKASLLLLEQGFKEVYQLEKGILNYFKEVGNDHFEGECFVFDQRIAVDSTLQVTGTQQCKQCQGPIRKNAAHNCA